MSGNDNESRKLRQERIIEADSVFYRNRDTFNKEFNNTPNTDMEVVILLFHADWLKASSDIATRIDDFIQKGNAKHMDGSGLRKIRLMKISVKDMKLITLRFRVDSFPTLVVVNKSLQCVKKYPLEDYKTNLFKATGLKIKNMLKP